MTGFQTATIPARHDRQARGAEWEDLDLDRIQSLVARSGEIGWREALAEVEGERPFFAWRMRNLALGNWHLLRLLPRDGRALDLGCGFGSLALGLAEYYRTVIGLDALRSRVSYATLRARQDERTAARFVEGSGLALPVRSGALDLVTMNGVLEWAGLYGEGAPRALQLAMLREVRRALAPHGTLAVAIENRFAMETLAGMPDTHTGLRLAPAVPSVAAHALSWLVRRRPFRTPLYDAAGYRRLVREAGYPEARVYDLVSSYNDYDFVVDPADAASYALLWRRGLVRTFFARAGRARRIIAGRRPGALGRFAYAYLVLAGADVRTLLDASHPLWARAAAAGVPSGTSRFAVQGTRPAALTLVAHDGARVLGAVEVAVESGGAEAPPAVEPRIAAALGLEAGPRDRWCADGVTCRSFVPVP